MPFEKVETQVDFPAQERAVLEFWDAIDAFEQLRAKNRGRPQLVVPRRPDHRQQPDGRAPRLGPHLQGRLPALLRHDRPRAALSERLRLPGPVGRGRGREGAEARSRSATSRIWSPATRSPASTSSCSCARSASTSSPACRRSSRSASATGWTGTAPTPTGPSRRTSGEVYFTMSEENNYTIWSFLKKCHERGLVYRGYDAMPWCPRCARRPEPDGDAEGYQLVAHRARASCASRCASRPRREPARLDDDAVDAHQQRRRRRQSGADLSQDQAQGRRSTTSPKARSRRSGWKSSSRRKEWVEGVPKLKTLEQIFKEKGGYEIVGEVQGADMVGWHYDGPFDELPAQQHPAGYPAEDRRRRAHARTGRRQSRRSDVHRVVAWKDVGETEGTGIVHIAPGCGKEDFQLGKEQGLPPVAPLDDSGVFLPGFGGLDRQVRRRSRHHRLDPRQPAGEGRPVRGREVSAQLSALLALQDGAAVPPGRRVVHRHEVARRDHATSSSRSTFLPESINGKARELDWLRNMGDWMISKKRFWGLALPIWVDEQTRRFRGDRLAATS